MTSQITPPWLIPDFLSRGSLVVLAGDAGVGKTVLSHNVAISVACGLPVLCFHAQQPMKVMIVDQENSLPDVQEYFRWAWIGLDCPNLALLDLNLRFDHFSIVGLWWDYLIREGAAFHPDLIIIDTCTPVCQIVKEEDNAEALRAISHFRTIQAACGTQPCILIFKHTKVITEPGQQRTIRGAKSWLNATDATIFHVARPGRPRKDSLRETHLEPHKVRAFGLRHNVNINPTWTVTESGQRGLKLVSGN